VKPLVRWTIGPVSNEGFHCLHLSIQSFLSCYDVEPVICHNQLTPLQREQIHSWGYHTCDQQSRISSSVIAPMGVAWKLYPPRLDPSRHELFIDNDLIITKPIEEITKFFSADTPLVMEGDNRLYGQYDKFIPPNFIINSGLFGLPPHFDFQLNKSWEINCPERPLSLTWDEQGFVAAILCEHKPLLISNETITNCETTLIKSDGMHFVGVNRTEYHSPFRLYVSLGRKLL
jgi:hypothetical protein